MNNNYYPVPKPKLNKQKKAKNNKQPTENDYCTYLGCNRNFAALHEIFGGKNRQLSIKYGLQVRLCYEHHQGRYGPHHNKAINDRLKREGQMKFEETHSREDFVSIFGKNYLEG